MLTGPAHRFGMRAVHDVTRERFALITLFFAAIWCAAAVPATVQSSHDLSGLIAALTLSGALVLLSTFDVVSYRLPDLLTLPLMAAGLALSAMQVPNALSWHVLSAMAAGLSLYAVLRIYRRVRHCEGLGLGDVKLIAAAGAWVGMEGLASVLLIGAGTALVATLFWRLADATVTSRSALPFGPFLALGVWVVWLYGPLA